MSGRSWRTWLVGAAAATVIVSALAGCSLLSGGANRPMLPLGPAQGFGQPYQPCAPTRLASTPSSGPSFWSAFVMSDAEAQGEVAAGSELVNYRVGGHVPLSGDELRVTVPSSRAALHTSPGVRLFIDGGGTTCITGWRVSARELEGFDGRQESGGVWRELGAGTGQADAVDVGGVPEGQWIVHLHLAYGLGGAAEQDSIEAYALVTTSVLGRPDPDVPAPALVAACGTTLVPRATPPTMELSVDGTTWVAGTLGVARLDGSGDGQDVPPRMPAPVVSVAAGALLRVRTADGSCGNDWSVALSVRNSSSQAQPFLVGGNARTR